MVDKGSQVLKTAASPTKENNRRRHKLRTLPHLSLTLRGDVQDGRDREHAIRDSWEWCSVPGQTGGRRGGKEDARKREEGPFADLLRLQRLHKCFERVGEERICFLLLSLYPRSCRDEFKHVV
jgi:hypothetical protein